MSSRSAPPAVGAAGANSTGYRSGSSSASTPGGREGLSYLEANPELVDVVVSDLGMPDMNGWDVAKAIQARWAKKKPKKKPKKAAALITDLVMKGQIARSQCAPLKGARPASADKKKEDGKGG